MATIQHSVLSGGELHEPKGIASATSDQVYVADGVGGGVWRTIQTVGWENIQNNGAAQSLSSGVRTTRLFG